MSTWDSADILAKCKLFAKRPTVDATTSNAEWFMYLTMAQDEAYDDISVRCPEALLNEPTALTAVSGDKVFNFGTDDNGYPVVPRGHARIYPSLASIPNDPWQEGLDYSWEGTRIRIPADATYTGTLYGQWVDQPDDIAADSEPSLQPGPARILLVLKAVELWAASGGIRPALEESMGRQYMKALSRWLLVWRTSPGSAVSGNRWTAQGIAAEGAGGLVDGLGAPIVY